MLTESETEELVYNLNYEKDLPRLERSINLDYDEMNYILNCIKFYRDKFEV